jgi:hypothetical protein
MCTNAGVSLFYVQQAAHLLLCTNRCFTMIDAKWLRRWMSYKMHIVYSVICWLVIPVSKLFNIYILNWIDRKSVT